MSTSRNRLNVAALTSMLGGRPPAPELAQPLQVAALGAGGGGGLDRWRQTLTVPDVVLTVGAPYYNAAGTWTALDTSIGTRQAVAVCIAATEDPDVSTLILAGAWDRSGTAGAILYASAAGAVSETFPGDSDDETLTAPWVWQIGWQITADLAVLVPCDPYRPRLLTYCLGDGETQLVITTREYPADP